ncbi:uncharacterized protein LOC121373186 [Gigantopelta aegis]|uniref:uncharacterized protein LOC121373186 n=1 Tax=Gigantopelta aegis TaxID=1735272 RepID=UPI001B8897CE|nr:uncharacterized protein LOC121373186 [Gigantopelta aegis]XP_041355578.1 uncharacterized protein LOC121373186 [Gigantopelta aegis]
MWKEVSVFIVLSLAIVVVTGDPCNRNGVDGCSIPGTLPPIYKRKFTSACNRHDICYFCGSYKRVNRGNCDSRFRRNMIKKCDWWNPYCKRVAMVYYLVVRAKGSEHYNKQSPSWCSESWVPRCMG